MEHTEGKLQITAYEDGWLGGETLDGQLIFKLALDNEANALRLVKCWNSHDDLVKQRDDLLEACRYIISEDSAGNFCHKVWKNAVYNAKKAIKRAGRKG